ncbi:MAG TPA: DUF6644 family protein [Methylomirabilota bacterium]|nr:DUF6644 family protein [Methylomirabilota bacterium]
MHPPSGPAWLVWLETTQLAVAMRQWLWLYPIVEIVHILGFVILVGAAFMFDLRLLGLTRGLPVSGLASHLLRWSRLSLWLVIPSGLLMFTAHATEMAVNPAFRLKLLLIATAGINAGVFHRVPFRSVTTWDARAPSPGPARAAAVLSLLLWTGVISCGRLLAYF